MVRVRTGTGCLLTVTANRHPAPTGGHMHKGYSRAIAALALSCFACLPPPPVPGGGKAQDDKPSLKQAILDLHRGLESKERQQREDALRKMLPARKDIELLFPKHAEKLWPVVDEHYNQHLLANVDKVAAEITKGGAIEKMELTDVRQEEAKMPGSYQRVLAMIPKDVPVFRVYKFVEKGGNSSDGYLLVHGRWVFIKDFYWTPELIDKLDGKKP